MAAAPVLIVIGGLPGTGKSTVAGVLVRRTNPLTVTRDAWRGVARDTGAGVLEVGLVCTDLAWPGERTSSRSPTTEVNVNTVPDFMVAA